jgi:hypothetical protein
LSSLNKDTDFQLEIRLPFDLLLGPHGSFCKNSGEVWIVRAKWRGQGDRPAQVRRVSSGSPQSIVPTFNGFLSDFKLHSVEANIVI